MRVSQAKVQLTNLVSLAGARSPWAWQALHGSPDKQRTAWAELAQGSPPRWANLSKCMMLLPFLLSAQ